MYKWRYLQFISDNVILIIIVHQNHMFMNHNQPYISYTFFNKSTKERYHEQIQVGDLEYQNIYDMTSLAEETSLINISIQNMKIHGTINCKTENGPVWNLIKEKERSLSGKWSIITSRALFNGIIKERGVIYNSPMYVYVDEQYGEIPLSESLNEWCWYSLINETESKIGFTVKGKNNGQYTYLIENSDEQSQFQITNHYCEDLSQQLLDKNCTVISSLPFWNNQPVIVLKEKPLRFRFKEKYSGFNVNYFRFACLSHNRICGICEYMKIDNDI